MSVRFGRQLGKLLRQVLKGLRGLSGRPSAKAVHALRVAIRRFDSAAEALGRARGARAPARTGTELQRLFESLGRLRSDQVAQEWVRRLARSRRSLKKRRLLKNLRKRARCHEDELAAVRKALDRALLKRLAKRYERSPFGVRKGPVAARKRRLWLAVRRAAVRARRSGSPAAFHRLRIAVKKYRYFLEMFEPGVPRGLMARLNRAQDGFGNAHDLDALSKRIDRQKKALGREEASRWLKAVSKAKAAFLREGLRCVRA